MSDGCISASWQDVAMAYGGMVLMCIMVVVVTVALFGPRRPQ